MHTCHEANVLTERDYLKKKVLKFYIIRINYLL